MLFWPVLGGNKFDVGKFLESKIIVDDTFPDELFWIGGKCWMNIFPPKNPGNDDCQSLDCPDFLGLGWGEVGFYIFCPFNLVPKQGWPDLDIDTHHL